MEAEGGQSEQEESEPIKEAGGVVDPVSRLEEKFMSIPEPQFPTPR